MSAACPALPLDGGFLATMLGHVDCQAQAIGAGGYQALAAPGSGLGVLLTATLTIFVALFGYRLVFGETPGARDGVIAAAKLGMVLVLATSWPAFRTLAYDVALSGPAELAARIGEPAGLPGAGGGLVARLQGVDEALAELGTLGSGKPLDAEVIAGPSAQPLTAQQQLAELQRLQQASQRPRWDPVRDGVLLGQARTVYLAGAIGAFASVRLLAGLLLALGPLFALFLLFDATRGLFEGWVRGLAGAALGALATAIVLGVELALLEPWLATILAERNAGSPTPSVPIELLAATLVFALTLLAVLVATAKVAAGFRFSAPWRAAPARVSAALKSAGRATIAGEARSETLDQRSRAFAIADAVAASQRRENAAAGPLALQPARDSSPRPGPRDQGGTTAPVPLGQSFRRRTGSRVSAGAARRDRRA